MDAMTSTREREIEQNFRYFQEVVDDLMKHHAGEYALLHRRTVVEVFKRPIEALEAGYERFTDGMFSIQKVIDRPLDLGFMSYGAGDRAPH
jgi:hypothetical protein